MVNSTYSATGEFVFAPESEMFIATSIRPKTLAPLGAKPANARIANAHKGYCAPSELRNKQRLPCYKHLAPLGEAINNVPLYFEVEFARCQNGLVQTLDGHNLSGCRSVAGAANSPGAGEVANAKPELLIELYNSRCCLV